MYTTNPTAKEMLVAMLKEQSDTRFHVFKFRNSGWSD
jgi:hypothetical protein